MARNDPQVNLRIPAELKASLDSAAANSGRSLTAEIVARLSQSFEGAAESAELDQLRFENATLKQMLEGKSLGTDLAAVLAVTLAGQTLGMIDAVQHGKTSQRELQTLRAFADLVLAKQPADWPSELMRAYEATPSDAAGAKAKRELDILRRIGKSLVTYYESQSQAKRLSDLYDQRSAAAKG